jgi:hypothetical protein
MPSPAKNSQMFGSGQALEVAIVDVEKAAEVIRLATPTAFGNGAMTERYFSPKQSVYLCNQAKRFPLHKMEKA